MLDWKSHIRSRLASLQLSPAREREIVEELAQHLEDRWRELVAGGATPDDAAHTAKTEFDGARLEALLGTLRQAHWRETPPQGQSRAFSLDSVRIDLRHAIRALRATPSFTIGALLVLALGTGATTAIFSVVDAVALRPLPFPEPDRIVAVGVRANPVVGGGPQRSGPAPLGKAGAMPGAKPPEPDALSSITAQDYLDWADQEQVFEGMAALSGIGDYVFQPPGAEPELVKGDRVTASFFDVLQARPMLGAVFTSRNEVAGSDRVVVVSHAFWQRHFGRDPSAVGRTLALNGESYTIVGVMPAGFAYPPGSPQPADLWTLWVLRPQDRVRGAGGARSLGGHQSIARLRPDVSLDQAQAQMSQVAATIAAANPGQNTRMIGIRPLRDHLVGTSTRLWMLMLLAAVGIVLVIACANVANLWLARASEQQRDAAVRAALGASRGRLVQRVLIESLIVSMTGTVIGVSLAWVCVRMLTSALPESLVRVATISIDGRVLTVAVIAALATGLVSSIAPALHESSPALATALNESARAGTSRGRRRVRALLVVAEVALAVVLLVGAALFIASFINVMRIDPGFRPQGVLAAQLVPLPSPGVTQIDVRPALADIVDRARRLPGVIDAAAAAPGIPFRIQMRIDALAAPGVPLDPSMAVSVKMVTAGYYRTLAIPLTKGRYFTDEDREGAEAVVILSDAAARMPFAGDDPLGRIVVVAGAERRVVGIVANARQASLEVTPHPEVYLPLAQGRSQSYGHVLLHTSGNAHDALPALRAVVAQVLPQVPLRNVARLEDLLAAQTAERRLSMLMFGLFGLLGLVISAVGIFGVIAYLVSQQTRDIGIRMALGATRSRVVAGVFGQVALLVAGGLVVGGFIAWSLSNAAGRFLFGLDPADARAYAVAMITLVAAAFVATLLPARRAASIDPTEALRNE